MPVIIPGDLPAARTLAAENMVTMTKSRANRLGIRPLKIAVLNLMPTKETTETQLLRVLGNTPLSVEVVLVRLDTHQSRNTSTEHLQRFYRPFSSIVTDPFHGLVITGAPVEHLPFEEVTYWQELTAILEWSRRRNLPTFHICWGAQAALYWHYGIAKHQLPKKCFGVFPHRAVVPNCRLLRGFDDYFHIPHSRHTTVLQSDIERVDELQVVASSEDAGVGLIVSRDGREVYATGHSEYEADTLAKEYARDLARGLDIELPVNYFPNDDPAQPPLVSWRSHGHLLFSNWLHYYVSRRNRAGIDMHGEKITLRLGRRIPCIQGKSLY